MKYTILLWPHANARYQAESLRLAHAELQIILNVICPDASVTEEDAADPRWIRFTCPEPLTGPQLTALRSHSLLYILFQEEGPLLRPLAGPSEALLGTDLPSILKYKGKTNERFTAFTMNLALYASSFAASEDPICFSDPMCSRGTSLFLALNRGWNADGMDLDRTDLHELDTFFRRYLEYGKIKHKAEKQSCTVKGARPVPMTVFRFHPDADLWRAGNAIQLRFAEGDCALLPACMGKKRFHVMAADLPYGVRHSAGSERFDSLMRRVLPVWREALLPGGAVAISYNTNTLKTELLRGLLTQSGFTVMTGAAWDGLSHWVEQAVTRDVAVAVRPAEKNGR